MARIALLILLIAVLVSGCSAPVAGVPSQSPAASSSSTLTKYRVVTIVEGLEHPWGMAFLPGNEGILVTERPGRLRLVRGRRLDPQPIAGLPEIRGRGEGGLLDVALHPAFEQNRLVYFAYSKPGARGGTTALARGRLEDGHLVGVDDVFVAEAWGPLEVNYGGRIVFDREGHLFLTVGDRRDMERSQDLRDHVGTTIRLHEDGRVPIDNPFVGRAGARLKSSPTETATRRGWQYTQQPVTSGRAITDRTAETGSTASERAGTTDGRRSVSATTTTAGRFPIRGPATAPNCRSITGIPGYLRPAWQSMTAMPSRTGKATSSSVPSADGI
jgi:hypothetical protein